MNINCITIIGLGLIGGSLAKALKRTNLRLEIRGLDCREENLKLALEDKSIDIACRNLEEAVDGAQAVFLCTPVNTIKNMLKSLSSLVKPGTIITDVGSTKKEIMDIAKAIFSDGIYFIGGHPMTGAERSGYVSSIPHLFENAYYILTPHPNTPIDIVSTFSLLISSTGALPIFMDPAVHDQCIGAVSHLPHVVASALVNTVMALDDNDNPIKRLAAGGFKDITRIASSDPKVWRDISLSNKNELISLIAKIIDNLQQFKMHLETDNDMGIEEFYKSAKEFRDQIPSGSSIFLLPYYELYADIEDKPGNVGRIASILGDNGVNIKNIRIINSRLDEPGCLVISLPDREAQEMALSLLSEQGFSVYRK